MRTFTSRQRKVLFALSGGYCQICGATLDKDWHADHKVPFSNNGLTSLINGQAVCAICNLKKSNKSLNMKTKELRGWQENCYNELERVKNEGRNTFLAVAGVGSGKTFFSAYVFNQFQKRGEFDSVIIISPTENIKRNWSVTFQQEFGTKVDHGYQFKHSWPRDCQGVSLTYQSLTALNLQILKQYVSKRVFLIIDEVHHAGDEKSWGEAILELGDEAGFVLLLSGTPKRGDNSAIPFVKYKEIDPESNTYELQYDYYYGYAESVKDKVCCGTIFPRNFSKAETFEGYETLEYDEEITPAKKRLYNNIITVREKDNCYVYATFLKANEQLNQINDRRNANYAGLIVCNTIDDATRLHEIIHNEFGAAMSELVTSDDKDSSRKIERFKTSSKPWIISINMISEGVDIERIRCIVYASNVVTNVRFIQVMGRGVRNPKHMTNDNDVCYMFIPDYKPLVDNATAIEQEIRHIRKELEEEYKKEYVERDDMQISFDDMVLSASSEDSGNVFSGVMFDVNQDTDAIVMAQKYNVSKDIVLNMWKDILEKAGHAVTPEEKPIIPVTITEEKERVRKLITKVVGKINYHHNIEFAIIHNRLNKKLGKPNSNSLTLEELKQKLQLAQQYFENLN